MKIFAAKITMFGCMLFASAASSLSFAEDEGRMESGYSLPDGLEASSPKFDFRQSLREATLRVSDSESVSFHIEDEPSEAEDEWHSEATSWSSDMGCDSFHSGICRDPGWPHKPCLTMPGDRDWGDCPPLRYRMNDCDRAGKPFCFHRFSLPSITRKYKAGWVGGGTPFFGRSQCTDEGVWGLDYGGLFGRARVWMKWTKLHRYQGGEGAYKTDGRTKLAGIMKKGGE